MDERIQTIYSAKRNDLVVISHCYDTREGLEIPISKLLNKNQNYKNQVKSITKESTKEAEKRKQK